MSKEKVIKELTKEQEAMVPEYLEKYKQIGLSTRVTDRAKAEKAVTESYLYLNHKAPKFTWVDDPIEGAKLAAQFAKGDENVSLQEIRDQASLASYGSFEAQWVVFYAFIAEVLGVKKDNLIDIVKDIIEECGLYWTFEGMVVMSPKPTAIHMNAEGKLHNTEGLALEYSTGRGIYAVNGVRKENLAQVVLSEKFEAADGKKDEKAS